MKAINHLILLVLVSLIWSKTSSQSFIPGEIYIEDFVEYRAGNLPFIISVPHGGTIEPLSLIHI